MEDVMGFRPNLKINGYGFAFPITFEFRRKLQVRLSPAPSQSTIPLRIR